jgi:DNA-directed RNA polymerase specialized sigma24 family protein
MDAAGSARWGNGVSETDASGREGNADVLPEGSTVGTLVRRAAAGDQQAWERVVDQYARLIWSITEEFKLVDSDAVDVAQTTWLRLLGHIDRIEDPDRVGSWLEATARNECLRSLAARKRMMFEHDDAAVEAFIRGVSRAPESPRLVNLAVFLVGPKRSSLRDEWRSHLSGETGRGLVRKDQTRAARGFLWAAARLRLQDVIDWAWWRPVEVVLRSRGLSTLFVLAPSAMVAVLVLRDEGALGVVKSQCHLAKVDHDASDSERRLTSFIVAGPSCRVP